METTAISENKGWVKFHRKLLDNPISKKPNYLSIFVYLLLKVNHKNNDVILDGKKTTIKRGQLLTSIFSIAEFYSLSTSTVSKVLKYLETERMIEKLSTNKYSLITVLNYNIYQDPEIISENKTKTDQNQNETNNNNKNENKYTNTGKSPEDFNFIEKPLRQYNPTLGEDLKGSTSHAWQEKGQRYADNLKLKFTDGLDKRWFKMFKEAANGKSSRNIEIAYSYVIDHPKLFTTEEKVKMFFWVFNNGLNNQLKNK
ncbi:MAG: hypothetical protein V1922_00985 [bacterium]